MERNNGESLLGSVGRAFLLFAALTSAPSFALDEVCSPESNGNPVPEVEGQVTNLDCAAKGGFQNSCAYQEWLKGRFKDSIAKTAKEYTDRVSRLIDPACDPTKGLKTECNLSATEIEIAKAFNNPKFVQYFSKLTEYYADNNQVAKVTKGLNLGPDEAATFERVRASMRSEKIDPLGWVLTIEGESAALDARPRAEDETAGALAL